MKTFLPLVLLMTFNSYAAETVVEPSLFNCHKEALHDYVKPKNKSPYTIPTNIIIEPRELSYGDPAIWSFAHMIKIEFPVSSTGKKACFLIDKAELKSVRSIGYDSRKGRLLELKVAVATGDDLGNIGQKNMQLKVRVNQAAGKTEVEK